MSIALPSPIPNSATPATWIALAPHEAAHGNWRFFEIAGSTAAIVDGPLSVIARRVNKSADITVVAPLTRCIVMAVDLPPLQSSKLQQALAGVLSDRLIGASDAQHYAAAPLENGRIREAAACDAAWLKQCIGTVEAAGLRVAQVIPEASLLPRGAAWWGQLQADQLPAWLLRAANGEAVRVAPLLLDAVLPPKEDTSHKTWQWFADPACDKPPATDSTAYTAMGSAALLRNAANTAWDLRQFAFAPPDGAARFMTRCTHIARQRSGRFAAGALLALLAVNVLGLNGYALKQRREINARHAEMERIVLQALPGVPRLLEPAVQLEAAWQRTRSGAGHTGTATLLGFFAQTGSAQTLTALDVSERTLRATFAEGAALERSLTACQSTAMREPLQRAGVRCAREGERLLLEFARESVTPPQKV